jgi:hypothetical protein
VDRYRDRSVRERDAVCLDVLIRVLTVALFFTIRSFELASEIDRQHGEESLKQKIDVLPGHHDDLRHDAGVCRRICRSRPHSCVARIGCGCREDSSDPAPLGAP